MTRLQVFDPAMCCSTGVCGPQVDPQLPRFAADLEWLRTQGVEVERYNLAQQPKAFVETRAVKQTLKAEGEKCLPLVLLDGEIVSRVKLPVRDELAALAGVEFIGGGEPVHARDRGVGGHRGGDRRELRTVFQVPLPGGPEGRGHTRRYRLGGGHRSQSQGSRRPSDPQVGREAFRGRTRSPTAQDRTLLPRRTKEPRRSAAKRVTHAASAAVFLFFFIVVRRYAITADAIERRPERTNPMKFLSYTTRNLFFTGKGGVGKTSLACATAVGLADRGKRVLLVSTDPASNLDEVLGVSLGSQPTAIPDVPGLRAMNLDADQAASEYRERLVGPYRGVLPETVVASMEEQLSGSCTVEIAAFDEFSRLLGDPKTTAEFDHVVFDTAPTGHTLRLLSLPAAWSGFIDANTSGTSCLGPLAGLQAQHQLYKDTVQALSDPQATTLVLVSRAERSALAEAERIQRRVGRLGSAESAPGGQCRVPGAAGRRSDCPRHATARAGRTGGDPEGTD